MQASTLIAHRQFGPVQKSLLRRLIEPLILRSLLRLTYFMPCREIRNRSSDDRYLERYFVGQIPRFLGGGAIYIHRFLDHDDASMGPHDHPWNWGVSWLLVGNYGEHRLADWTIGSTTFNLRSWLGFSRIRRDTFHAVELPIAASMACMHMEHAEGSEDRSAWVVEPIEAWTLFVHGPWTKGWGFDFGSLDDNESRSRMCRIRHVEKDGHDPGPTVSGEDGARWWETAMPGRMVRGINGEEF